MSTVVNANLVYKLQQQITQQAAAIGQLEKALRGYIHNHPCVADECQSLNIAEVALASISKEQP